VLEVKTDIFSIYTPKKYPGNKGIQTRIYMLESSDLSKSFQLQGIPIRGGKYSKRKQSTDSRSLA
jgi:hypothetical protein